MGTTGTTSVDPAALRAAAQRIDTAADLVLGAVHDQLDNLQFDGSAAGRVHVAAGAAVRAALDRLCGDMRAWAHAAAELAAALRVGADRHAAAEAEAAAVMR